MERVDPPSCLISVHCINRSDTVPVLHYGVILDGIIANYPVKIYIHRCNYKALKATDTNCTIGITIK